MDTLNHKMLEVLREGYRQDKNGRWFHKGKYGPPKELIWLTLLSIPSLDN